MYRYFKLLFFPLDGGGWVGMKEKATYSPPLSLPSREGISLIHVVAEGIIKC